jgi:hypothetical protein
MSRNPQSPITLPCPGCGLHYLTREQVMDTLGLTSRSSYYRLALDRRYNGTVRCDDLRTFLDGGNHSGKNGETKRQIVSNGAAIMR